ncbi:MAG: CPP1-like family protein [Pseudanabaenaceae cyanobacterium]
MSNPNPYAELGVSEDASFEEVRSARDRLLELAEGDTARQEEIEAAYDAVLMDRLRARKEGRITVPDRIRYAERTPNPSTGRLAGHSPRPPSWLSRCLYTPTNREILTTSLVMLAVWVAMLLLPNVLTTWLAVAVLVVIYFINNNGRRFGWAVLFAFLSLALGFGLAYLVYQIPALQFTSFPNTLSLLFVLIVMWLSATFLC